MQTIVVNKGTKDEKEYLLEMTFNTVVDTNAMEKLEQAGKILTVLKNAQVKSNAKKKNEEKENEEPVNMTKKMIEFFGVLRGLVFVALQEHHAEDVTTENEAGKIIELATKKDTGLNIFDVFKMISECTEECGFLSQMMEAEGKVVELQDHKKAQK